MEMNCAVPRVTVVVVTYQSTVTLAATIQALKICHDRQLIRCIFVDNNSIDNTPKILSDESSWADVILTKTNNGFGRGCNIGLAKVETEYTLFLNPDAHINDDSLITMITFMDSNPVVGIAGPATMCGDPDGTPTYQGTGDIPTPLSLLRAALPLVPISDGIQPIHPGSAPFCTGWVCGAVFMIRTDLARRLNGFDPRFFLYWEEMDLCRRARSLGYETWAIGTAYARHVGGASSTDDNTRISGCIGKDFYQSRYYYMTKHHGWFAATAADLVEFFLLSIRTVADLVRGRGMSKIRPRLQAALLSQPAKMRDTNNSNSSQIETNYGKP